MGAPPYSHKVGFDDVLSYLTFTRSIEDIEPFASTNPAIPVGDK